MDNQILQSLHSNQRLLVEELLRRGAHIDVIDLSLELLEVELNGTKSFFLDRFSSVPPYHLVNITADKRLVKDLLRKNNISVPEGSIFIGQEIELALEYAESQGYPLVFKPNWGSYGDFVSPGISNFDSLASTIYEFMFHRGPKEKFIIEKHITGNEYRIFITSNGKYAVLHREPAHVVGDGINNIETLAEIETERRISLKATKGTSLCPIVIDQTAISFLKKHEKKLSDIPANNEKIYLRYTSNLALGGVSIDFTEQAHSSVIALAKKVLNTFKGLPCLGIDFITEDITRSQDSVTHAVIEVNSSPGLVMHMQPAVGNSIDVAAYLADVMFPNS